VELRFKARGVWECAALREITNEESRMTDKTGGSTPFGGFSGFSGFNQADMMEKMWDMMRMNPFAAAAMQGGGGQGMGPSLSMMSDMMAPLTNVEELDKRIKDMRAVEQWLNLNLNMLQSAIQALEVQRATLATLRAFGAYAQSSVERAQAPSAGAAPAAEKKASSGWPHPPEQAVKAEVPGADEEKPAGEASFDPSGWWNLLQTQFNQLASLAVAQAEPATVQPEADKAEVKKGAEGEEKKASAARKGPAKKKSV
jgi:hypothetical protein